MGRIFITRHGQTVANRERVIQGPRIDAELSDLGHQQAHSLGHALAPHQLRAVYSSPLLRARATAAAIAQHHRTRHDGPAAATSADPMSVQVATEIYEMDYGQFIGQRYEDVADAMEQVLDAWRLGFVDQPFPGGESAVIAQHRVRPFVARLVRQAEEHDVAVVGHGRINRVILATLTGQGLTALESFPQSNAAITELEVQDGQVRVVRLNDTSHLSLTSDAFS